MPAMIIPKAIFVIRRPKKTPIRESRTEARIINGIVNTPFISFPFTQVPCVRRDAVSAPLKPSFLWVEID